jgi:hypothetical protein
MNLTPLAHFRLGMEFHEDNEVGSGEPSDGAQNVDCDQSILGREWQLR